MKLFVFLALFLLSISGPLRAETPDDQTDAADAMSATICNGDCNGNVNQHPTFNESPRAVNARFEQAVQPRATNHPDGEAPAVREGQDI